MIANRYGVEKLLGEGAAGKVYLVKDKLRENEPLALKLLDVPEVQHLELLRHEFSILAKLRHPNIARVYDFGFDEKSNRWFYTSEFIEGSSIVEACRELDFKDKSRQFAHVLRALQHIHSRGIIHYDVKPSNILVDLDGIAKLIDFGLATTEVPITGAMRGTIGYAAPEAVRGELGDPRSDLYSLGVVFYKALVGRHPFENDSVLEILKMQATSEPEPLREFDKKIPVELERVVLRLLERDPGLRYYTANEVNRALSQAVDIPLEEETSETAMAYLLGGGFVGREKELRHLRSLIDSLGKDSAYTLLCFITAETGVGKTRLLREAGYYAQLNGVMLIRSRCAPLQDRQSGLFPDAVRGVAAVLPKKVMEKYTAAMDALKGKTQDAETDSQGRIIHETVLLFIEAAKEQPILISIDDTDQADEDTLAFLKHLARVLWLRQQENERLALLVLGACNTEAESAEPVTALITSLSANGLAEQMALSPLSGEAEQKLLSLMLGGSEPPEQLTHAVHEVADGCPLVIEQAVQQLYETGHLFYELGKWRTSTSLPEVQLPAAGAESLKQRIERLSDSELAVIQTLACLGRPGDFDLLNTAAGLPGDTCASEIAGLISRRLLSVDEDGNYSFSSGRMAEVVLKATAPELRKAAHGRIYSHLKKIKADIVDRALHADMADIENDELLPLLKKAGESVEITASVSTPLLVHEALLRRLPPDTEEWFRTVIVLVVLNARLGRTNKILEYIKRARRDSIWRYPEYAKLFVSKYVDTHLYFGEPAEAEQFVKEVMKRSAGKKFEYLRAAALYASAQLAEHNGDLEKARNFLHEAREKASANRDFRQLNFIDYTLGRIDYRSGQLDEALRRTRAALKRKSARYYSGIFYNLLGIILKMKGETEKALEYLQLAFQHHEKAGNLNEAAGVRLNIGNIFSDRGEFEKALDAHTRVKRMGQVTGDPSNYAVALLNIGNDHYGMGRIREALTSFEEAIEASKNIPDNFFRIEALRSRANVNAVLGITETALADLGDALKLARQIEARASEAGVFTDRAHLTAFLCGDLDAAKRELSTARSLLPESASGGLVDVLALSATFLILKREADEALQELKRAEKLGFKGARLKRITITKAKALFLKGERDTALKLVAQLEKEPLSAERKVQVALFKSKYELHLERVTEAVEQAEKALRQVRQIGNVLLVFEAAVLSAECAVAALDVAHAREYVGEAEEVFDKIAAALPEEYDRKGLRAFPFYSMLDSLKEEVQSMELKFQKPVSAESPAKQELLEITGMGRRNLVRDGLVLLGMVSRLIEAELDVDKILNLALGTALDVTGAGRGFVILIDEKGKMKHLAARDILNEEITSPEYQTSHTLVKEVISTGKPRLVADIAADESLRSAKSVTDLGLHSVLCVPIIRGERAIGVVYLDSTSPVNIFTEADLFLIEEFVQRIAPIIINAVEQKQLNSKLRSLEEEVRTRYSYSNIVGRSKPMRELFRILDSITDTDLTVCIYGETGTGKELVAKALHYNSSRKDGPFVTINCGAVTESLLESELFGHVEGAFTGASSDKPGLIETADGGMLFLDEIGSMPLEMQVKLLRVIEEHEVRRVGSAQPVPVDIRFVCSTNTPLEQLVEQKLFREDLFYRLDVVRIDLPLLRERREDIPLLVEHFLKLIAGEMKTSRKKVSAKAKEMLVAEDWPGNVRELENRLRQAMALAQGDTINSSCITAAVAEEQAGFTVLLADETLEEARNRFEKELFVKALKDSDYNYSKTARRLGMDRAWFYNRCKRLGIKRK